MGLTGEDGTCKGATLNNQIRTDHIPEAAIEVARRPFKAAEFEDDRL